MKYKHITILNLDMNTYITMWVATESATTESTRTTYHITVILTVTFPPVEDHGSDVQVLVSQI